MRPSRAGLLALALLLAPLVLRVRALVEVGAEPALGDLRGFVVDLGMVALATALLSLVSRWRVLVVVVTLGWTALHYANDEHLRELGALLGLAHAGYVLDPTFFFGSLLAPTRPGLLAALALASCAVALLALRGSAARVPPSTRSSVAAAVLGIALLAVAIALPQQVAVPAWRQTHFLLAEARWRLLGPGPSPPTGLDGPVVPRELGGAPRLDGAPERPNVLLVMLEGVSGLQLPSVARTHGREPQAPMLLLDAFASRGLVFDSFVAHQRQTNRGEYALLCGDYPKLATATPKMSELAGGGALPCLPAALAAAGYTTVYLQAAPLRFMLKDQFMKRIGFERVIGDTWFEGARARSVWGVDDRTFLEQSVAMLRELDAGPKPWFLTLLTVGTHHPYTVPDIDRASDEADARTRALAYLDAALGGFVAELQRQDRLDDTLVILTSDEAGGTHADLDDLNRALTHAWTFLSAHGPGIPRDRVVQPFAQVDLPLSVLDYLGLAEAQPTLGGRSVFRSYAEPRTIAFANTYARIVGWLDGAADRVTACDEAFSRCATAPLDGAPLFALHVAEPGPAPDGLRAIVEASLRGVAPGARLYRLLDEREVPLDTTPLGHLVLGGQFVSVPADAAVQVRIEFRVRGADVSLRIGHALAAGPDFHHVAPWRRAQSGDVVRYGYEYRPRTPLEQIEARLKVFVDAGRDVSLDFAHAELRVLPGAGDASGRVLPHPEGTAGAPPGDGISRR